MHANTRLRDIAIGPLRKMDGYDHGEHFERRSLCSRTSNNMAEKGMVATLKPGPLTMEQACIEISSEPKSLRFVQDAFGNHLGIARFSGRFPCLSSKSL